MAQAAQFEPWTDGAMAEAERLWASGLATRVIGVKLDRPLSQVKSLINGDRARFPRRYDGSVAARRIATLGGAGGSLRGGASPKVAATTDPLFSGAGIPLVALTARSCRYIVAGEKADALFCGDETAGGSWCRHHGVRVRDGGIAADAGGVTK